MTLTLHRVLHAGYLLEHDGTRILFDPIFETPFSVNCHPWPPVRFDHDAIRRLQVDAVFISHYHDDHFSLESLHLLPRDTRIHLFCQHADAFEWITHLGFSQVNRLHTDSPVTTGPFRITPLRALDTEVDCLLRIEVAGLNLLNVVDAWLDEEMLEYLRVCAPWDLILWPQQVFREMAVLCPSQAAPADTSLPADWQTQLQALQPAIVIPSACQFIHEAWSWWRTAYFPISTRHFMATVREWLPRAEVIPLPPGEGLALTRAPSVEAVRVSRLPWVLPDGPQDVDYHFDPHTPVPGTDEIARHLGPLETEVRDRILHWCTQVLPDLYASLEHGDDWFDTERRWTLLLWHANGEADMISYRILEKDLQFSAIRPADATVFTATVFTATGDPTDWLTELPAAKLAGALWRGETLSSLYIRINDRTIGTAPPQTGERPDPLQDPLLRVLYENDPLIYQRYQARAIQSRKNDRRDPR
jgi:hypothetical protein